MNVAQMRRADRWIGMPVCWLLTRWRRLWRTPEPSGPAQRILFIKLAEQGSTVLAQAALQSAIDRVGRDNVFFLLFAENRPILDLLDLVPQDNIIAIRTGGLLRTCWEAARALWRLRRLHLDACIDLEFFARSSAAIAYLSGAKQRVGYHGYSGEASYRGDLMTHRLSFNPYLHTSQTFQIMVEALDQPPSQFPSFDLVPGSHDSDLRQFEPLPIELERMRRLVCRELQSLTLPPLILLNANASDLMPLRRWPGERYVELAQDLLRRYPRAAVAFTGGPSESAHIGKLVAEVDSPRCIDLSGKTTMRELLALYTLAEVLVTNDSGPAHFATLTPVDVVVLFGPETPKLFAAQSPRTVALWAGLACSPCINAFNDRNSTCSNNLCMQRLEVEEVLGVVCERLTARVGKRVELPVIRRSA